MSKKSGPKNSAPVNILWFRLDLRLTDNPALLEALRDGGPVVPVYIWSPLEEEPWEPGAASRWWLHQSLESLQAGLRERGSRLILRKGPCEEALRELVEETGAGRILWTRRYEPALRRRDARLSEVFEAEGVQTAENGGSLLFEPPSIRTDKGEPYQVFSAFWRACLAAPSPAAPGRPPKELPAPTDWPASLTLEELGLEPEIDWAQGLRESWQPGELGASRNLDRFLRSGLEDYPKGRNLPARPGTSRLSPHLHFGEISPRQVWHRVLGGGRVAAPGNKPVETFLSELGWREFAHHLLYHFPKTPIRPLRSQFQQFPWKKNSKLLKRWQRGRTGYPIVDAGMRELWRTGWMHNRVRMIVASFLVKHLLIPWQEGTLWFWDTLVDADLANNTLGWQWTAGCGADAAPYFRIFNPMLQGKKFDSDGEYVRRWIPELSELPSKWIHQPWEAPEEVLEEAGVELGKSYPRPLVDHREARRRALDAFQDMKS